MPLDVVKGREQTVAQRDWGGEITVVSSFRACVVPKSLLRVEIRRILGQSKHLQPPTLLVEPCHHFRMRVIGGIVLDQKDAVPTTIKTGQEHFIDKRQIGQVVEILRLMPPRKPGGAQRHRAENLLRMTLPSGRNFRAAVTRRPSLMNRRTLAEGCFVLINDHRAFGLGVFLDWGRCNASTFSALWDRPALR